MLDTFYGVNPLVFGGQQIRIGTQTYTAQGLQRFVEESTDLITQKKVISRLHAFQKANANDAVLNDDYVLMTEKVSPENRDLLYIGNALSVALWCKEYELAEKLAKKGMTLRDGQTVPVFRTGDGAFRMGDATSDSVMKVLLQRGDIPEEVWYALWECYSVQEFKASRNRFLTDAELKTVHQWWKTLGKKPQR